MLFKSRHAADLQKAIRELRALAPKPNSGVRLVFDLDPLDLM